MSGQGIAENNRVALSPRRAPARLQSNSEYVGPRKNESLFQTVAIARGYTIKAGKATRARLTRGVRRPVEVYVAPIDVKIEIEIPVVGVAGSEPGANQNVNAD